MAFGHKYSYLSFFVVVFIVYVNIYEFISINIVTNLLLSSLDELVLLFSLVVLFKTDLVRVQGWILFVPVALVASIIVTWLLNLYNFNELRFFSAFFQSLINFKFFMFFILLLFVQRKDGGSIILRKALGVLAVVSIVGFIANLLLPNDFIYSTEVHALERGRIVGFQLKPNDLALFCSFLIIYVLFDENNAWLRGKRELFVFILVTTILLTTSRTALLVVCMVVIFYLIEKKRYGFMAVISSILLLLFMVLFESISNSFFVKETLSNLSELNDISASQYIRGIMLSLGVDILIDKFPIGYGAGNFGTVMSYDSPVYEELGVAGVGFFINMIGVFDSNAASIFGEYGVIGVIGFLYFIAKVSSYLSRGSKVIAGMIFSIVCFVSLTQPMLNYQVNSINLLLVLFVTFCSGNFLGDQK